MNKKMCGFIYGVMFTLFAIFIVNNLSSKQILLIYLIGSLVTFITGCFFYVLERKNFIQRNYKFGRPKPKLIEEIKRDLERDGKNTLLRLGYLTSLSWLALFLSITDIIEEKFKID